MPESVLEVTVYNQGVLLLTLMVEPIVILSKYPSKSTDKFVLSLIYKVLTLGPKLSSFVPIPPVEGGIELVKTQHPT